MRLLLIRHAAFEGAGEVAARDGSLSAGARARAAELERWLPKARAASSSPALCAVQTAEAIGLSAEPDIGLADWASARDPGAPVSGQGGGAGVETLDELMHRVGGWLADQAAAPGTRHAITHDAVVRAAVLVALGAPPAAFHAIGVAPCSVTELGFRGGAWQVVRLNWEPVLFHVPQRRSGAIKSKRRAR